MGALAVWARHGRVRRILIVSASRASSLSISYVVSMSAHKCCGCCLHDAHAAWAHVGHRSGDGGLRGDLRGLSGHRHAYALAPRLHSTALHSISTLHILAEVCMLHCAHCARVSVRVRTEEMAAARAAVAMRAAAWAAMASGESDGGESGGERGGGGEVGAPAA